MEAQWTPMRWPNAWKDPGALSLLQGTAIDYLLIGKDQDLAPVRDRARQMGIHVADPEALPSGISIIKGEWPGVKMSRGGGAELTAGPTGVPWVDSNGWAIRLAAALDPGAAVWVDAPPPDNARPSAASYLVAMADSAAYGGRWILSLDNQLSPAIAAQRPEALAAWKKMAATAAFFSAHQSWSGYAPRALVGVVSDFSGPNEFFSRELLNLLGRAGLHYIALPKTRLAPDAFGGLRALIYPDSDAPSANLRNHVTSFVQAGGLLVAAPRWGDVPGTPSKSGEDPRYAIRTLGRGRIALAKADPDDPYLWTNDAALLVSHRYDLVRFWNGGATGSFYTMAPEKHAVVHLLFYANRGPDSASVRIAGRYRTVTASTVEHPQLPKVEAEFQSEAVEVHLPQVPQYVALELET